MNKKGFLNDKKHNEVMKAATVAIYSTTYDYTYK